MVFYNFGIFHSPELRNGRVFYDFIVFHSPELRKVMVFYNLRIFHSLKFLSFRFDTIILVSSDWQTKKKNSS